MGPARKTVPGVEWGQQVDKITYPVTVLHAGERYQVFSLSLTNSSDDAQSLWRQKYKSRNKMVGKLVGRKQKRALRRVFACLLAEKAGFEPAVGFTPRTLSRRVT